MELVYIPITTFPISNTISMCLQALLKFMYDYLAVQFYG